MLRKTVTANHGEGSDQANQAAEKNDLGSVSARTAELLNKASAAEEAARQAAEDKRRNDAARARTRSGIPTFSGCVC